MTYATVDFFAVTQAVGCALLLCLHSSKGATSCRPLRLQRHVITNPATAQLLTICVWPTTCKRLDCGTIHAECAGKTHLTATTAATTQQNVIIIINQVRLYALQQQAHGAVDTRGATASIVRHY
eukprot:16470-Heterococcus_DN1.PRE.4